MKLALQALLIAPDHQMRTDILFGTKTITIREGYRDYHEGRPVMICCHIVPWAVLATITSVRYCTLNEVTEEENRADGFESREDMLGGMQKYYPDMTLDSEVTVIRWKDVTGFLSDYAYDYSKEPRILYAKLQHKT